VTPPATTADSALEAELDAAIRHLASFERPSASEGERRAAEWIAARLDQLGAQPRIEAEAAHGTYWWPLGLLCGLAGLAALQRRRGVALAVGAFAAAGIADDVSGGRLWFRRLLPRRTTWNVVAEAGDRDAEHTVVLVAHHDAARSGLVFHPALGQAFGDRFPELLEKANVTAPVMFPVFGGPLLVALGALTGLRALRRAGLVLSLGAAAAFAEIGSRETVPGANDNLSGVAAVLGVARTLQSQPVAGIRVLLVSTGSEESFMEGMQGFARRHFPSLDPARTHVICIDTVGSPHLIQLEGEGMLRMRDYPEEFKALVSECAQEAGVPLRRGLRFRNATDGLLALKAGYPTVMLGSVNRYKLPDNYHWPTDVPDNVLLGTVAGAVRVCDRVVRRLAQRAAAR
jgi:hypothetical protein